MSARPVSRATALAAVLGAVLASAFDCGGQDAAVPDCPGSQVPQQDAGGQWSCVDSGGAS